MQKTATTKEADKNSQKIITVDGHFLSRQYTPTSVSPREFQVPIKLYPTGKFTKQVKEWAEETEVEWIGPFLPGHGDWLKDASHLLCVAAGTGIAPFVRLIESLLEDDDCDLRIQLVFCVRSAEDLLFKDLLDRWTKHWNFSLVLVISSLEESTSFPHLAKLHLGSRLKEELFLKIFGSFGSLQDPGYRVAVCGSKSFEKDIINFTKRDGLPDSQMFRFPG